MKKANKLDLFGHCCSPGYLVIFIILIVAAFSPSPYRDYLYVLFFLVLGGACLLNYSRCGRVHCQITGWGFLAVGILALLKVLNVISLSWNMIWTIFIIVLVVGFGVEFLHKGKTGTCYVKVKK